MTLRTLTDFDGLSFDCYGTLIDWESGIHAALQPLLIRAGEDAARKPQLSRDAVLEAFARLESRQQEKTPDMLYPAVLAAVHGQLAIEWDVARDEAEDVAFGASIGNWPSFSRQAPLSRLRSTRYSKRSRLPATPASTSG